MAWHPYVKQFSYESTRRQRGLQTDIDRTKFILDHWQRREKSSLRVHLCDCNMVRNHHTQNPGFSAYTQHWVLYTWYELIMSISQVCKPLHEFEEDLSRSYLILTLNLLKLNLESTFSQYVHDVWGVWHTHVFLENVSIACEYLAYSNTTQMLFKWLIINANLCVIPKVEEAFLLGKYSLWDYPKYTKPSAEYKLRSQDSVCCF